MTTYLVDIFGYMHKCGGMIISKFSVREVVKKTKRFYIGKSPKLWVGGGQES